MNTNIRIKTVVRQDLLYPELSYRIVGILFDVFNTLGYRYQEKYYQRAIAQEFKCLGVIFQEQVVAPVIFKEKKIGSYIYDFLIDNKIILEIKRGDRFSLSDINQLDGYLKNSCLKLGILARFSSKSLLYRRIVNV